MIIYLNISDIIYNIIINIIKDIYTSQDRTNLRNNRIELIATVRKFICTSSQKFSEFTFRLFTNSRVFLIKSIR